MTDHFEFKVWAHGQARDADGTPLDADGNRIEPESSVEDNTNDTHKKTEESK